MMLPLKGDGQTNVTTRQRTEKSAGLALQFGMPLTPDRNDDNKRGEWRFIFDRRKIQPQTHNIREDDGS